MIDNPSITHDLPTPHVAGFVNCGDSLAKVYAQDEAEYRKSARLIAAAPDMLAALEAREKARAEVRALSDAYPGASRIPKAQFDAVEALCAKAEAMERAALAKAEGRA